MSLEEESDESLMRRLRDKDHQAFSILVKRHSEMFYGAAYRTLLRKEEAEDIVQICFLKIWDRPGLWKDGKGATFKTWFYRIVINQCMDQMRQSKKIIGSDNLEHIKDDNIMSDMSMIEKEQQNYLNKAIMALPEKQMLALNLCFYEGVSNKEAADIIGVKVKALESLLMRAKTNIKKSLLSQGLIEE